MFESFILIKMKFNNYTYNEYIYIYLKSFLGDPIMEKVWFPLPLLTTTDTVVWLVLGRSLVRQVRRAAAKLLRTAFKIMKSLIEFPTPNGYFTYRRCHLLLTCVTYILKWIFNQSLW